jgi:hypothetical protein
MPCSTPRMRCGEPLIRVTGSTEGIPALKD